MNTNFLSIFILRLSRALHRHCSSYNDAVFNSICPVCGSNAGMARRGVLWPELVLQWQLTPAWANWIDQREGLQCTYCRSNLRSQQIAQCLINTMNNRLGANAKNLSELCDMREMQTQMVAETNAAGNLHPYLSKLEGLYYSEYGSYDLNIPSEDLQHLSYADNYFDLVINSDVLEHIPNIELALSEIRRVLKPEGIYIFSVPVIWSQSKSRCRARMANGQLTHLLPPSYHGNKDTQKNDFIVFHEFGKDFTQICKNAGFSIELYKDPKNPSLVTFLATKKD